MEGDPAEGTKLVHQDRVILPLVCLALGFLCLVQFDFAVGQYFRTDKMNDELEGFVDAAEHFGTPFGQIIGLLCLTSAFRWSEWRIVRFLLGAISAGLAANLVKAFIERLRPRAFDFSSTSIWESFGDWLPLGTGGSSVQSFPSAHTASAFGFAAVLSSAYPKGKPVFLLLAALTGFHRIAFSAHFPSDVFFGAALGWFVGCLFSSENWLGRKFNQLEQRRPFWLRKLDEELQVTKPVEKSGA